MDTLTFAERISLRTNAVDWTLLTPNLGVEFDVKSTNWNRWAVGLTLKTKWNTPATFKNRVFYNITEVRADFRNYWRTRQINNKVPAHTGFIDRLFSCRRRVVKHPKTTYYRGAYMSFSDFSIKFGREGHQGKALSAGITYGIIKPLYAFRTGNTLDLDLGFDAGFVAVNSEKFIYNRADNCYTRTKQGSWKVVPFPMPTAARVGFVYRFGSYPITKKYRWRYDADAQYQYRIDSIANQRVVDAINKHNRDSVESVIYKEFWQVYDSAAVVNSAKADSMRIVNAKLKAEADRKQAEADRLKAVEAQKEKERLKAEKKNKGKKAEEKPEPTEGAEVTEPNGTTEPTGEQTPVEGEAPAEGGTPTEEQQTPAESEDTAKGGTPTEEQQTPAEEVSTSQPTTSQQETNQSSAEPGKEASDE
ncbi:putative uncharacterized protein [Leyella stercorea CAG:629]|uniref:Uncharacterized protein n=1 Tax=Leyella stercorea CAG:629 TaxID=1263103 RepID=R7GZE1_9BACT|nr:putative uncharacterized protein [Leyella stercorea CAG:629]